MFTCSPEIRRAQFRRSQGKGRPMTEKSRLLVDLTDDLDDALKSWTCPECRKTYQPPARPASSRAGQGARWRFAADLQPSQRKGRPPGIDLARDLRDGGAWPDRRRPRAVQCWRRPVRCEPI